jgi:hypothetical protein
MKAHAEFYREHGARFQGGNAAECREMYDMLGTMILPERDAEGRLCTLLVPSRMDLSPAMAPQEYAAKLLRSVGFLMESLLDDPCDPLPLKHKLFVRTNFMAPNRYVQVNGMAVFENFAGFSLLSAGKMKSLLPEELQTLQMGLLKVSPVRLTGIFILNQPW